MKAFFIFASIIFFINTSVANGQNKKRKVKINLGPSLTIPTENRVYVWWNTNVACKEHHVEYGIEKTLGKTVTLKKTTKFPNVSLTSLKPGTDYYYRVVSDSVESKIFKFCLPDPKGKFRIIAIGDNQNGVKVFSKLTIPYISKLKPDFLIHVGDMVHKGDDYKLWRRQFYKPAKNTISRIPWFPVRGNHDGETDLAKSMLPLPTESGYYAVKYGYLYIVILNTNIGYTTGTPQYKWFKQEIESENWKNAKFRLVCFHKPPFTSLWDNKYYRGEKKSRTDLVPLLEKASTDLVICGHSHSHEMGIRSRPDKGKTYYFTTGGAGGPLETVHSYSWDHIKVSKSEFHVLILDVSKEAIRVRAMSSEMKKAINDVNIKY